jgi:predicted nucleotidyltransferase component of viral defense system
MLQAKALAPAALGLLRKINGMEPFEHFCLVGGTNLALRYGHRVSVDLDFFSKEAFVSNDIVSAISRNFRHFELVFQKNQTLIFDIEGVRVDFVQYPFEWLRPFEIIDGIRFAQVEDLIPMKIQGIENRKSKKDFWDIALLMQHYPVEEMFNIMQQKFPFVDVGHLIHSFTYFDDADLQPDPLALDGITWEFVKETVRNAVLDYSKTFLKDIKG